MVELRPNHAPLWERPTNRTEGSRHLHYLNKRFNLNGFSKFDFLWQWLNHTRKKLFLFPSDAAKFWTNLEEKNELIRANSFNHAI